MTNRTQRTARRALSVSRIRNVFMPQEYQSTQAQSTALIEDSYSFVEAGHRPIESVRRANTLPAKLFRYRVLKRSMDIVLVLLAAPVLLPVILVVAVLVRMRSPGPIFFSHRRISRNGAFFPMWKFPTMCNNSAEVLEEYLA